MTQSKIYLQRIKKLQKALQNEALDAFFVANPIDLFYLTGMHMSLGHLIVTKTKARLFVDGRYFEAAKKQSAAPVGRLEIEEKISSVKGVKKMGFDGSSMTYSEYQALQKFARKGKVQLTSNPDIFKNLRLIKDAGEIAKMRKSAKFAYAAYEYIRKLCKPGVTELDIAKRLEIYCLEKGAERMSFEPIIAFGKNTALPHHHPGKTKLQANDIILFDLGVVLDDYCSDMTRVDFIGKKDPKLEEIFHVNHSAQKAAIAKCKPGVTLKELDVAARKVMKKAKMEKYFIHSLGHGIGLEVHESPRIKFDGVDRNLLLEPGMAITIEPGLYLPGKGGVRYEDTVVITKKGVDNLFPKS